MKIKNLLSFAMVMVMAQLLFSCSSQKYYEFAAHKQPAYNTIQQKPAPETEKVIDLSELALAVADEKAMATENEPVLEANTAAPVATKRTVAPAAKVNATATETATATMTEAEAMAMAKEKIASMTKAEKKELKKDMKEALKQDRRGGGVSIIEVILAVLLPPLAVFLHDGIGTSFWINIVLTLLFFLPGIIHALLVVTDTI